MSDNSRKLYKQNPLLTAAGQGFPFDDFSANTLLMPITPAAPEPLHHEQQQQEIPLQSQSEEIGNSFLLHPSNSSPEFQHQFEDIPTAAAPVAVNETVNQQQQQGYFTSILSSLPNLSLSSIRDQPPPPQPLHRPPSHPAIFDPSERSSPIQNSTVNSTPQHFPSSQFPPAISNDPSRPIAPPTVALPPPSAVPPVTGSVSSYRLGNQRRLKYAPPPDLTSIPPKTITPPTISSINSLDACSKADFSTSTYSTPPPPPPSFLQNESTKNLGAVENILAKLPTGFNSNITISGPQDIPSSKINRHLVTPNNTPADYFLTGSTFDANYQSTRDDSDAVLHSSTIDSLTSQSVEKKNVPSSENFSDIDLSQSSPSPVIRKIQQEQVASSAILFTQNITSEKKTPIDFFSSSTAPESSFFDTKNSLQAVNTESFPNTIQTEHRESSNISLYNPLDYTSSSNNNNNNINLQSEITCSPPHLQTTVNDGGNISNWSLPPAAFVTSEMPEPTGTATLSPVQTSIYPLNSHNYQQQQQQQQQQDTIPPSLHNLAGGVEKKMQYRPVYHHWFYSVEVENKILWHPFSMHDSLNLEEIHNSSEITPETKVPTDGGRYDVEILKRQRSPVYWPGEPTEVKRSSWFYKGSSGSKYVPYDESIAARLEEEFKQACTNEHWNRKIDLSNGEYVVFHSPTIQIHYLQASTPELVASWGNTAGTSGKVNVVKRGVDEFHIEEGEPKKIDHLLFLVHGIGSVCDLKFRSVEEVVDEFRSISLQLAQSHYRTAGEHGKVNRIEVLPISWHTTLHSEATGIDKKLKAITLESIPRLRHFTNDTLLDVLFYTSPTYCQTIMQTVGNEMNRLHSLFKDRNPDFDGSIYLGGHSLGSLIVFDLLCHQKAPVEENKQETIEEDDNSDDEHDVPSSSTSPTIKPMPSSIVKRKLSRKVSYVMGAAGTGQPFIVYPHLNFHPKAFFALGSPIGMFVTVRGIDKLGENFRLPTCPSFFNIFHPFDPVAYRVESLVNPDAYKHRPMLIPHHKGRKRMHLELKETMARVGADLKQKILDSVKNTWNSVYQLAMFHRTDNQLLEHEINKVVDEEMEKSPELAKQLHNNNGESEDDYDNDYDRDANIKVGNLNGGRRIDYVLQEAPFEYINEYIFALTSHVCYWESEDTMLMILKEIYGSNGIQADAQLPQQTMTIERQSPTSQSTSFTPGTSITDSPTTLSTISTSMNVDPTAPINNKPVGPPPLSGFVRNNNSNTTYRM